MDKGNILRLVEPQDRMSLDPWTTACSRVAMQPWSLDYLQTVIWREINFDLLKILSIWVSVTKSLNNTKIWVYYGFLSLLLFWFTWAKYMYMYFFLTFKSRGDARKPQVLRSNIDFKSLVPSYWVMIRRQFLFHSISLLRCTLGTLGGYVDHLDNPMYLFWIKKLILMYHHWKWNGTDLNLTFYSL